MLTFQQILEMLALAKSLPFEFASFLEHHNIEAIHSSKETNNNFESCLTHLIKCSLLVIIQIYR